MLSYYHWNTGACIYIYSSLHGSGWYRYHFQYQNTNCMVKTIGIYIYISYNINVISHYVDGNILHAFYNPFILMIRCPWNMNSASHFIKQFTTCKSLQKTIYNLQVTSKNNLRLILYHFKKYTKTIAMQIIYIGGNH